MNWNAFWLALAIAFVATVVSQCPAHAFVDWHLPIHLEMHKSKKTPDAPKPEVKPEPVGFAEVIIHHYVWEESCPGMKKCAIKVTVLRDKEGKTYTKRHFHLGKIGDWFPIKDLPQ